MIAYIHLAASVAQMVGSLIVFVTAIEAIIFLNKILFRHQWVGAISVVIGICLVALAALRVDNEVVDGNIIIGLTAALISPFFQATQMIIEEKILRNYHLQAFEFIGWEGTWGL
mmetsp:Transcript_11447/g.10109  ORF Transcript_11447/g.10109 Transcript_11447/m.10109 type:complete len:114 (+) Transcript_11447:332-673(+)